jgi:hypothetical protein
MTTHLIIPDSHAHYQHHNKRAEWLGELIADVKPDVVVHIGDNWDMPSLSSYDRGRKSFQGRSYRADVDAGIDFHDRLWGRVARRKKSLPRRAFCIGNHEQRIARAIDLQPELEGAIGYQDLQLDRYYDEVVDYQGVTPGSIEIDGISYAHYFVSGVAGRPVGGEHPASSLITKKLASATQGHLHLADWSNRMALNNKRIMGCFVGCYQDYQSDWAGVISNLWWSGVVIKRNVEDGCYDPEFVSIGRLKKEYGRC